METEADLLATKLLPGGINSQYGLGRQTPSPHSKVTIKHSCFIKVIVRAGSGDP